MKKTLLKNEVPNDCSSEENRENEAIFAALWLNRSGAQAINFRLDFLQQRAPDAYADHASAHCSMKNFSIKRYSSFLSLLFYRVSPLYSKTKPKQ